MLLLRSQRVLLVALVGVLLAALALRLEQLGAQSLWYDETVSAHLAAQPLTALVAHTARDIHPPLYYILLRGWGALAGQSEFVLAFFSLAWGVLLVASAATLARWLGGHKAGLLAAALLTLSPFNIWYSQEVRMYTLGATLGVWTLMALWQLLRPGRMRKRWMTLWVLSAAAGLWTLYYFVFLLFWEALVVAVALRRARAAGARVRRWLTLGGAALLLWLPWLPIALRQALDPPVPPWREPVALGVALMEALAALAVGQSFPFLPFWPLLLLLVVVMAGGLWLRHRQRGQTRAIVLLLGALLVPLAILLLSSLTPVPLYHVRYLFLYSPAFYILLAMAFVGWGRAAHERAGLAGAGGVALLLLTPLLVLSAESVQRFWNDPAYAADDLRGGVRGIEAQWRSGDVLLANAGYTYSAFTHYLHDPIAWRGRLPDWRGVGAPDEGGVTLLVGGSVGGEASLGWGMAESDFYPISEADTLASLGAVQARAARLWHFRLYDTVTDPAGRIREWLDANALLFHDQLLTGESNARVQGWYFPPGPNEQPSNPLVTRFLAPGSPDEAWVTVHGLEHAARPARGRNLGRF